MFVFSFMDTPSALFITRHFSAIIGHRGNARVIYVQAYASAEGGKFAHYNNRST